MYTHQPKYSQAIQSDIKSGKIKPNLEAKARVERSRKQNEAFKTNREFIKNNRGIDTIALFPKYSQRVLNRMFNFLTNQKNGKNTINLF